MPIDTLMANLSALGSDWLSAIAACVAIIVNIIGLAFIWLQLRSNQKAVKASTDGANAAIIAARTALMSERPWIRHTFEEGLTIDLKDGALELNIKWHWKNVGKTPAIRVIRVLHLIDKNDDFQHEIYLTRMLRSPAPIMFPNQSEFATHHLALGPNDGCAEWRFVAIVAYDIPGDSDRRVTAGIYRLKKGPPFGSGNKMYPSMANSWTAEISPLPTSYAVHT